MPFKNVRFLDSPVFKIIKDFNFYPFPKSISFRTDLDRTYNELKTRNIDNPYLLVEPSFKKILNGPGFMISNMMSPESLKFDFTATNLSRIDEPPGGVDKKRYASTYDAWRDSVMV